MISKYVNNNDWSVFYFTSIIHNANVAGHVLVILKQAAKSYEDVSMSFKVRSNPGVVQKITRNSHTTNSIQFDSSNGDNCQPARRVMSGSEHLNASLSVSLTC